MNRDARLVSDAAMRDAAVQLCLLHEDLGLLRTVRVYGMENVDKQRFDEHLERYRGGRRAADQDRGAAEPDDRAALRGRDHRGDRPAGVQRRW